MTWLRGQGAALREWNYKIIGFKYSLEEAGEIEKYQLRGYIDTLQPLYDRALKQLQHLSADPDTDWASRKKELEQSFAHLQQAITQAFAEAHKS